MLLLCKIYSNNMEEIIVCVVSGEKASVEVINSKNVVGKKRVNRGDLYLLENTNRIFEKKQNKSNILDEFKQNKTNQLICFELKYFYVLAIGLKIDSYLEAIEFIKEGWQVNAVGKIKDTTHHLYCDGEKEKLVVISGIEKIDGVEKYFKAGEDFFKY